jgi:hypothetical protein
VERDIRDNPAMSRFECRSATARLLSPTTGSKLAGGMGYARTRSWFSLPNSRSWAAWSNGGDFRVLHGHVGDPQKPDFAKGMLHGSTGQLLKGAHSHAGNGAAEMGAHLVAGDTDVLIVVDVQNDFCPGGRLPVPGGSDVVPVINQLAGRFANIVVTQDWHPHDHFSFASMHPGKQPNDIITAPYGPQILWPDHCVQGTSGAQLHASLCVPR